MKKLSKILATAGLLGLGTINSCSTDNGEWLEPELSSSSSSEVIIDPPYQPSSSSLGVSSSSEKLSSSSEAVIIDPPTPVSSSSLASSSSAKVSSSSLASSSSEAKSSSSSSREVSSSSRGVSSSSRGVSSSSLAASSSSAKLSSSSIATGGDDLKFYTNVNIHKWSAGEWIDGKTYQPGDPLETAPAYSRTGEYPAGDTVHVKVSNGTMIKLHQASGKEGSSAMCAGTGQMGGVAVQSATGLVPSFIGVKLPDEICNNR